MRRGLDDVSLSAVAEAAEAPRPSVYKAFGNRAGLGRACGRMAQTACGPVVYLGCSVRRSQRPGKDGHSWRKGALPFLACSAPHRLSAYVVAFSADGGRAL
ncbi:TetR/AcrR family transcriptional regulator [Streptomyces sp. NPDC006460]|uniref:TetR/AcrR family transcriptional regulator n=1 Tax=Streptomyces sp. NPDC006460 TaxID=3154304 RepID=UPI0033BCD024